MGNTTDPTVDGRLDEASECAEPVAASELSEEVEAPLFVTAALASGFMER